MTSGAGERDAGHWQHLYETHAPADVSWHEPEARGSLDLVRELSLGRDAPVVDVGAGASVFVDGLLADGFLDVTLLDVCEAALAATHARIGPSERVTYATRDVRAWDPPRAFALWHDRAAYHFMTTPEDREAYRRTMGAAIAPGAHAIVATFAEDGPLRCSGLPVRRYSAPELASEFAGLLTLVRARRIVHTTPRGVSQPFTFGVNARAS